jgi:hypothetical protein
MFVKHREGGGSLAHGDKFLSPLLKEKKQKLVYRYEDLGVSARTVP